MQQTRNKVRAAGVALATLASITGFTLGRVRAQSGTVTSAEPVAVTIPQLVFTVGGKKTTVTADNIVLREKPTMLYRLNGNFHVVGPNGWEFEGKDAELKLLEGPAGKMLGIFPRTLMRSIRPVQGSDGKVTIQDTTLGAPGEKVSVTIYLNPKTVYANQPERGN